MILTINAQWKPFFWIFKKKSSHKGKNGNKTTEYVYYYCPIGTFFSDIKKWLDLLYIIMFFRPCG